MVVGKNIQMSYFLSTLSQDCFKQEFLKAFIKADKNISILKPSIIWHDQKFQAIFSRIRKILHLSVTDDICICPTNGYLLLHESLPYSFTHEVVPFLWDCWPGSWEKLLKSLDVLHVRLCFVTSKQVSEMLKVRRPKMKTVYVPEAVNSAKFTKGKSLDERKVAVFEIGRKNSAYHCVLEDFFRRNIEFGSFVTDYVDNFVSTLSDSKITVSFPRCDTNPEMAGNIETLTERYWEAMFSRCLIIGHAPLELVDLIGYNPVIEVDSNNSKEQLYHILSHISDYQNLADRNYDTAMMYGDWRVRIPGIIKEIEILTSGIK